MDPKNSDRSGRSFQEPHRWREKRCRQKSPGPLWQMGSGGFALAWKITSALKGHDELAGASVKGFFSYRFFYTRHGSDGQGFFLDFYQFLSLFLGGF